jgi:meso-butanediol dehydrogenase / (S,S)-butanediol dehydrogenase / diacetyl reductase
MNEKNRFYGKVVVITGASRGIGRGIALRFASEGANVALCANERKVHEVAEEVRGLGVEALSCECDVTKKSDVGQFFEKVRLELGRADVSIQNAGVITIARIDELSEEEWDRVIAVNTKGTFLCCQAAAGIMMKQGGGRIINISSGQAREGYIYTPHYAASKMGVIGITHSLAKELALFGITVNAICPGIINTDMWQYNDRKWGELLGFAEGEYYRDSVSHIPMKKPGSVDDVAGLAAFLASKDAAYITGQTIHVNGGLILT